MMKLYYCYHFIQDFVCGISVEEAKDFSKEHLESLVVPKFRDLD